ncbi:MAG: NTPase [Nitrospinota bacterium]|nr:MAG: NTPase [Nitrospinota bacterium]
MQDALLGQEGGGERNMGSLSPHVLLLTGVPGVGKTTLVRKVAAALPGLNIRGFITDEIRSGGRRKGFRLVTFQGESIILAHTDLSSPHRVGKYRVNVEALDQVVDSALRPDKTVDLYLIDEIGRMECCSPRFVTRMQALLDTDHLIVATIHRHAHGFIQAIKERPDVELWEVTPTNREAMVGQVLAWIEEKSGSRRQRGDP